jgi:hypothetical protein
MCFRHMTRTTNARIAGFAFLFYIAAGVAIMVLLASVAQRTTSPLDHRARLALDDERSDAGDDTLRSHARDQHPELAFHALTCRVG